MVSLQNIAPLMSNTVWSKAIMFLKHRFLFTSNTERIFMNPNDMSTSERTYNYNFTSIENGESEFHRNLKNH